jgi:hypothetical protein
VSTGGSAGSVNDAGPDVDDSGSDVQDAPTACNTLTNSASQIAQVLLPLPPPPLAGGTIEPGTYHRTADEILDPTGTPGPTGLTITETVEIQPSGADYELNLVTTNSTGANNQKTTFLLDPSSGGAATFGQTCPASTPAVPVEFEFSGSGTGATLLLLLDLNQLITFTKL